MSAKVIEKISKVMEMVQFLKKDGQVEFGRTKYSYLSEAKITENIRQACIQVGLVIIPTSVEELATSNATMAKVKMVYTIYDKESGESLKTEMVGYGMDSGDKSVYKALTGAYKYMQRQVFAIPTGDDHDKVSTEEMLDNLQKEQHKQLQQAIKETSPAKKSGVASYQKVYMLATRKGIDNNKVKEWAKQKFGMTGEVSLKDLSDEQLQELTQALMKLKDVEG